MTSPLADGPLADGARDGDVAAGSAGPDGRPSLDKRPDEVAAMFDSVARRYDLTNAVLSAGLDRTWRSATADALELRPGMRVLDLAAGTGTSSWAFAARGASVVACDFSLGMLTVGRQRLRQRAGVASPGSATPPGAKLGADAVTAVGGGEVALVAGDGLALPFAAESFDRVTISFGLRNVVDVDACLTELLRVTRPGGRLVICEFSRPTWAPWRTVYMEYLMRALPRLARAVSSSPDSYVYLAESIRAWPDQPTLAARLARAGWVRAGWHNLTGGIVALHRASRPRATPTHGHATRSPNTA